ncbi:MAG: hypothetical protein IPK82_20460 [Polyangiaceae bacterium]|nr:hypothetical protein [Polyangiaceae bacterium]
MNSRNSGIEAIIGDITDFAWNDLVERFEPPFRIKNCDPVLQQKLDEHFQYALQTGGQAQLSRADNCQNLDILKAFRRLVKHADEEYLVVALSAPREVTPFMSVFASKGTATHVAIPEGAARQLAVRLKEGERTRVLYVHNHVRGIAHDIFGKPALGPSTLDRETLMREYKRWLDTTGLIESEFYLVENRRFRKFIIPSAAEAWNFFQKACAAQ